MLVPVGSSGRRKPAFSVRASGNSLNQNLVHQWSLQERGGTVAHDRRSYHHGTLTNMVAGDWEDTKWGTVLDFDGTNDHCRINNVERVRSLQQGTLSHWINVDALTTIVFCLAHSSTAYNGCYSVINGSGQLGFAVRDTGTYKTYKRTVNTFSADEWIHFVVTQRGVSGSVPLLYVNGRLEATADVIGGSDHTAFFGGHGVDQQHCVLRLHRPTRSVMAMARSTMFASMIVPCRPTRCGSYTLLRGSSGNGTVATRNSTSLSRWRQWRRGNAGSRGCTLLCARSCCRS